MRSDRDDYVIVHMDNISDKSQFRICKECSLQGLEYDTNSIMHYHNRGFCKDCSKPTITKIGCPEDETWPADPACRVGSRDVFSTKDIAALNKRYCGKKWTNPTPTNDCQDDPAIAWRCPEWVEMNYCNVEYVEWMLENCKKSCGKCIPDN